MKEFANLVTTDRNVSNFLACRIKESARPGLPQRSSI
jgi:hypothetical protein